MVRATNSFPVPLAPVIRTDAVLGATNSISRKISCILRDAPLSWPREPESRSLRRGAFQLRAGTNQGGRILQHGAQAVGVDRFGDVVIRSHAHGLYGAIDRALRRHHDR